MGIESIFTVTLVGEGFAGAASCAFRDEQNNANAKIAIHSRQVVIMIPRYIEPFHSYPALNQPAP
jgi:hypothetical protein